MANRHIKVINGRRYYYQSIRKGKKVTSKYLGPVDGIDEQMLEQAKSLPLDGMVAVRAKTARKKTTRDEDLVLTEESYIG